MAFCSLIRTFASMKLSVVIPVYRVESTLNRCVESVLQQQIEDMEVILVDDGSPDCCQEMCDEWAAKDSRIRVIHKENGGLSDARNAGIEIAQGEFITFVDSDDWLQADTYASLLSLIGDADLLEYSIAEKEALSEHTYTDINEYWLQGKAYLHCYAWNKIYKRKIFEKIRFPKGKVFEDVYTLPKLLRHCSKIITTGKGFYHYTINPQGITATAGGTELTMLLDAHLDSGMAIDDEYYMYLLNIQMDVWEQTGAPVKLPERQLNTSSFNGIKKIKAIAYNILGINNLCHLNKLTHHFKKPSRW